MGLISLLISLAAEKSLSSPFWQFNYAFGHYMSVVKKQDFHNKVTGVLLPIILLAVPVALTYLALSFVQDGLLHLVVSTAILIICFGCVKTRDTYKCFLQSAFKGELTTCDLHYQQLISDKSLPDHGFGQTLVWLNYRYYISVMMYFVVFGAAGAVFYRLLCSLDEQQHRLTEQEPESAAITDVYSKLLFIADWLPVRLASFGLMIVGHFSKAFPVWIDNFFQFSKAPQCVLIDVAQQAEDIMVDDKDCTAEPCLLVKLAKRNVLLWFAVIAILTLSGVIS
ncbi:beta-lactamase regulator AmpE [Thalassotalea euphylliae]|uniref:Beta-lactamase regulator AmpE n=1 Tax=Thalassotalea euphylliae TaxID=1655234 RepID=A0A3E0ULH7_9GAMM|nr:beta-lactamase regulator AmpE [Thalassotalea euphylliae]REL36582.1 beta-lactamase regulator AmpE [Thalassotalea euphylliae]